MNGLPMLIAMREQEEKLSKNKNKKKVTKKPNKKVKKEKRN